MSKVQFVGGAMNNTVTALESIGKVIDINLFYCFNLWAGEVKLQGHLKSDSIKNITNGLESADIEVSWSMNEEGYAVCVFPYNEREVKITLT